MRMVYTCVLGLCVCSGLAAAQQPSGHRPVVPLQQQGAVDFESLFVLDEEGKPKEIVGSTDEAALARNELISDEEREALAPAIKAWKAKLERSVVENIDLAVTIDAEQLQDFDMGDQQRLIYVGDAVKMLTSTGSLTEFLHERGLLNDRQMQQNRRIVSDYQRGLMMYTGESAQKQFPDDTDKQMEVVMKSNYLVALRDPFWAYNRILEALARHPQAVVEALSEPTRAELSGTLDKVRSDRSVDAVRTLLTKLDYQDQRKLAEIGLKLDKSGE